MDTVGNRELVASLKRFKNDPLRITIKFESEEAETEIQLVKAVYQNKEVTTQTFIDLANMLEPNGWIIQRVTTGKL